MKHGYLADLASTAVRPGVSRQVFSGEGATLAWTTLEPGHTPRPHSHLYEQIVLIVAGTVDFHVGDESVVIGPGGLIVVPPNVEHWAETVGDEPVIDLSIFTPKRDEYAAEEAFITSAGTSR